MSLSSEQHEDAILVCGSIVATCTFFLSAPFMCPSVASVACRALLKPLNTQRTFRKLLASKDKDRGVPSINSKVGTCVADGVDGDVYAPRHDQARDEELVVRIFHAGFMVFLACQRWVPQHDGNGEEDGGSEGERAEGKQSAASCGNRTASCGFAACCGGVVKLDRADLLALCFEAVTASVVACGGWSTTSAASSSAVGRSSAFAEDDAVALGDFFMAVMERHPQSAAAIGAARLMVLLGGGARLLPCSPADDEEDGGQGVGSSHSLVFAGALIPLIANGDCIEAAALVADRIVPTAHWYATDVDVLLEGLRMTAGRETDADRRAVLERAERVVLHDSLVAAGCGPDRDDDAHALAQWLRRLALTKDYTGTFAAKGVTLSALLQEGSSSCMCVRSLGRLDILEQLGVDDMDDADRVYRVLGEGA